MTVSLDTNALAQQMKAVSQTADAQNGDVETAATGGSLQDGTHRVFVGNLNFETTEDELKKHFSQAGEIASVSLPTKRNFRAKSARPSGIAFVGYHNDADAQKAVELFDGKALGDRELNVAIARPLTRKSESGKGSQAAKDSAQSGSAPVAEGSKGSTKKSKGKKTNGGTDASKTDSTPAAVNDKIDANPVSQAPRRERGPPSDGVPSTKTLFVAGLDHKTTDAELKDIFASFQPENAHVALRPIQRYMIKRLAEKGEQRLGRGFGFVTFADQETQMKALKAMDGHKLGDRELAVKVAIDSAEKEKTAQGSQPPAVESDTA